jgi:formate dehydrogenase subunit beta
MNSPAWIGVSTELTDSMIFHLIRIFHQAGRCVECDACVRACPMGIDLRTFTKKIASDVRELFGFTPGFDLEAPPPLITFTENDSQEFITEPHKP